MSRFSQFRWGWDGENRCKSNSCQYQGNIKTGEVYTIYPKPRRIPMPGLTIVSLRCFSFHIQQSIFPNKLIQLLGGRLSPCWPICPFLQKYQSRLGLSLLLLDLRDHSCLTTIRNNISSKQKEEFHTCALVWSSTMSIINFIPRLWISSHRFSQSFMVPKIGLDRKSVV